MTDDTGAVVSSRATWPFSGDRRMAGDQRATDVWYTGQREEDFDGLGLYNYKARFYSTTLGRFVSVDPLVGSAGDPQAWNAYTYVRNNPLSRIDPTGMSDMGSDPGAWGCDLACQWKEAWKAFHPGECLDCGSPIGEIPDVAPIGVTVPYPYQQTRPAEAVCGGLGCAVLVALLVYLQYKDEINDFLHDLLSGEQPSEEDGRALYEAEVEALSEVAQAMEENGVDEETIARHVHEQRNALKVKYRQFMDPERVREIEERQIEHYGNPLGPTIEYLREVKKYTWRQIIESASKPGGEDLGY